MNYRPYSGYDLKKIFDTSVRHFWPADQSQIYRTLSRMSEKGWVEIEVIHQESRPDRKEYRITPAGTRRTAPLAGHAPDARRKPQRRHDPGLFRRPAFR